MNHPKTRIACPFCSEKILSSAKKCRYCGEWLNKDSTAGIRPTKTKNKFSTKKIFFRVVILILFIFIIKIFITPNNNQSNKNVKTSQKFTCNRTEPYKLEPEFERARSLRIQRKSQAGLKMDYSWYNCINIEYKDLPEEDGLFYFDENSSIQNLTIFVDIDYKSSDDLLTAILLEHEFTHIGQFINEITNGVVTPCIESEAQAFTNQLFFLSALTKEEKNSVAQKVVNLQEGGYKDSKMYSAVYDLYRLLLISIDGDNYCKAIKNKDEYDKCRTNKKIELIKKYVESNPYYSKQCANQ